VSATPISFATDLPASADVVIVGAGLAGLATALHLQAAGLDVTVLEAGDDVGGRVRSDDVEGVAIPLDRGFQVYNPAYPEAQRVLDNSDLDLQSFAPGVLVRIGDRLWRLGDPRRLPTWSVSGLRAPIGSPLTKTRLAAYARHVAWGNVADLEAGPDISTRDSLEAHGLGGPILERVLQPFLAGVFLEPNLDTSRRFGDLALRSFVRGTPALPRDGMRAIPRQLAGRLAPNSIVTHVRVTAVTASGVQTDRGDLTANSVLVAADPVTACALYDLPTPETNAVTTWYHLADVDGPSLGGGLAAIVVDGDRGGPLTSAVTLSNVVKNANTGERALVSSSALGYHDDVASEKGARAHLARLYETNTDMWELVATYPIAHALPSMRAPFEVRKPVRVSPGRYIAGDHRDTSSIQGALVSGRRAATALLKDRGVQHTHDG
jgi:hypothetical protein